jgi:hypothetical protein
MQITVLDAPRNQGENFSDVILWLAELEAARR